MSTPPVVLVVEDHSELLNVLLDALAWVGYEVVAARDPAQATELLRARPIDLLVSDPLPYDGGQDALAAIEAEFPNLPVVALADEEVDPGVFFGPWMVSGNRRTLRRPFRLGDLLAACRDAVPISQNGEEPEEE